MQFTSGYLGNDGWLMNRIIEGATGGLADADEFLGALETIRRHPDAQARGLFRGGQDLFVTRAPGRLDVMGGIADYSGSLVLQLPIREAVLTALEEDHERRIQIVSLGSKASQHSTRVFQIHLQDLEKDGKPVDYAVARALFKSEPRDEWAAYVAGVYLVLMRERGLHFENGARILIDSRVPEGKGVSSSAALEVSVMFAVLATVGLKMDPREIALLCQKVENLVVGAPCGVMDQMTAACGKVNRLLALLCQPAEPEGFVSIPEGIEIAGLDSGVRHAVSGDGYGKVRAGAFMGYRMISELAGSPVYDSGQTGVVKIDDESRSRGYLANIDRTEFERAYAPNLPMDMSGVEFLARYTGTTDSVTRVRPGKNYPVRMPTKHPIYEHFRVRTFRELLQGSLNDANLESLGELMYQSHESYSACGLGSQGTDRLVQLCRDAGHANGIYGAKITGGGSGGTVAVLGRNSGQAMQQIVETYSRETGHQPHVFSGSSPGAADFGHVRVRQGKEG